MTEIIINGPEGRIEAGFRRKSFDPKLPIALILHAHPDQGGSMNSKIPYSLFSIFSLMGFNTLRFNFRGIGRSEGRFGNGEGELYDAAYILDWVQSKYPDAANFWVGGFSFGAWIGMQLLMRRPEIHGFVSISPPANTHDFGFLAPCPVSGIIIQGTEDTVVPKSSVDILYSKLCTQKNIKINYSIITGADHFYNGKLTQLRDLVHDYLQSRMGQIMTEPSKLKYTKNKRILKRRAYKSFQ